MKENKGKGVVSVETLLEMESEPRPFVGDKRKKISKTVDLENLPSRRKNKRAKHRSSKLGVVKPSLVVPFASQQQSIPIHDLDSSVPVEATPSITTAPISSQPSQRDHMNLLENEDLAWERFKKVVTNEDVVAYYDMSLKEFEYSVVHDLFKVCYFILFNLVILHSSRLIEFF